MGGFRGDHSIGAPPPRRPRVTATWRLLHSRRTDVRASNSRSPTRGDLVGFLIAFLALFLLVLAGVSFAAVKLFTARDANGNVTAPGCLLGCATGLALAVVALLGLTAFVLGAVAIVKVR